MPSVKLQRNDDTVPEPANPADPGLIARPAELA
jgi:hypothetical protein